MATAGSIITRAMRLAGAIGKGESLDSDESADGLVALNSMLDSWSTERLFVYQILEEAFNLVVGLAAYTVGSGGNFNTTRPIALENTNFILHQDTIYPVSLVDEATFAGFQTVNQSQMPRYLYFDPAFPLARIVFDYEADQTYSFHMKGWKALQSFSALTTTLVMPAGHEQALVTNLAVIYGPEFVPAVSQDVKDMARESRARLKKLNSRPFPPVLRSEVAQMSGANILTGDL